MFGRPENKDSRTLKPPSFMVGIVEFYGNARSAFYALLEQHAPKRVWLPSYLCDSLIHPLQKLGIEYRYYSVDKNLRFAADTPKNLESDEAFLFIDYFGFFDGQETQLVGAKGPLIIEDASQALLSNLPNGAADYRLYSPRKTVGVPDGGVLKSLSGHPLPNKKQNSLPDTFSRYSKDAFKNRTRFDRGLNSEDWFSLFQSAEKAQPVGDYKMSSEAHELLNEYFDFEAISTKRRENYIYLLRHLREIAVFPECPNEVVPLGFPVVVKNRDSLRNRFFQDNIYPAIHWNLSEIVPQSFEESQFLCQHILTLPCDHRVGKSGLDRIIRIAADAVRAA